MSDREDIEREGAPAEQRPRREPAVIEGSATDVTAGPAGSRPRHRPAGVAALRSSLASPQALGVAAVAAAVVIGAGAAWLYWPDGAATAPPPSTTEAVAPAPPGDASSRTAAAADGRTAAVPAPAAPDRGADAQAQTQAQAQLENRLAAATAALAAINDRLAALEGSVRDAADAARAAAARADKAIAGIEEARRNGDEHQAAQQLDRGALDDLSGRLRTLESRQMTMRQMQDRLDRLSGSTDRAVRAALAAAALHNAIDRDRPFATELAAARTLGLDDGALATLAPFADTGLPRTNVLLRELSELLPDLRRAATPGDEDRGYLDRLQAGAVRMLRIRPVKDEPGDDPAAVLSRIEFKMAHDDIDAVIAELGKLPPAVKTTVAPWLARAAARRDALEAVRVLTVATLTRLGDDNAPGGASPQ